MTGELGKGGMGALVGPGLGSEGRARVGDAGVFHERACSLSRCAGRPSARSSTRRSGMGSGLVCVHSAFQISFVNDGEIPLLPLRCKDKASWEEHQPSVSRLP